MCWAKVRFGPVIDLMDSQLIMKYCLRSLSRPEYRIRLIEATEVALAILTLEQPVILNIAL